MSLIGLVSVFFVRGRFIVVPSARPPDGPYVHVEPVGVVEPPYQGLGQALADARDACVDDMLSPGEWWRRGSDLINKYSGIRSKRELEARAQLWHLKFYEDRIELVPMVRHKPRGWVESKATERYDPHEVHRVASDLIALKSENDRMADS